MEFTEEMKGWYTPGCPAYDAGYHTGRRDGTGLLFHLTISTDDVAALLRDPQRRMDARGWVAAKGLGPERLPVHDASFNIFAPGERPGRLVMRYDLPFDSALGPMRLCGVKQVGNDAGLDAWRDTTTLFTRLVHDDGREYARGTLRLDGRMFARQLTTFHGRPRDVARFGVFFVQSLAGVYLRRPDHGWSP